MAEENTVEDDNDIDVKSILDYREEYSDEAIVDNLVKNLGGNVLDINGNLLDIKGAIDSGMSATQLLDIVVTGDTIRDVGPLNATMQGVNTGLTNFIGMPVDMTNMALQGVEGLARAGINKLGGDVSTEPDDFLLSSPNPIGGGQSVRDTTEAVINPVYDAVGVNEIDYADSADEFEGINKSLFKGGEIIGENAPIAAGATIYTALKEGAERAVKVLAGESAATAGGSAAVATVSEVTDGTANPLIEMGAEFVGNVIGRNPSVVFTGTKVVGGAVKNQIQARFGKENAIPAAVDQLLIIFKDTNAKLLKDAELADKNNNPARAEALRAEAAEYTPEGLVASLDAGMQNQKNIAEETQGIAIGNLTSGNISDSPALAAVQRALQTDKEFDTDVKKRIQETLEGLFLAADVLARGNNPIAAEAIRQNAYQKAIATQIFLTEREALKKFDNLTNNASIDESSLKASQALFDAKDNWRATETALWERIPKNIMVSGEHLRKAVSDVVRKRLLPEMSLTGDAEIDSAITRMTNGDPVSIDDLLKLRSILLDDARSAAANNNFKQAGVLDLLADATLNEIDEIPGDVGDIVSEARGFSRALNDHFSRYWNKRVLGMATTGGTNIRSKDVLTEAFGDGGGREANTRFSEMQAATTEADTKSGPLGEAAAAEAARKEAEIKESSLADDGVRSNVPAATADGPFNPNTAQTMPTDDDIIPEVQVKGRGRMVNQDDGYFDVPSDPNNPIPEYTVYDRVRGQKRPDPEIISDEEFIDGASDFYDPNNNAGKNSPTGVAIRDEGTKMNLGVEMSEAQENFLRGKVMAFKGTDGKINLQAVENFYANNAELINRFPDLKSDMDTMIDAQRVAYEIAERLTPAATTGQLPDEIMNNIANDPIDGYARLASEAKAIDQIVDFRNATIDGVFNKVRNSNGDVDVFKLASELLNPRSGRQGQNTSLLDIMTDSGILSVNEQKAIGNALVEAIRIEKTKLSPDQFDQVVKGLPDIAGNLARIAGANLGVLFGRGDASLQAAAIGSQYLKNQLDKFPTLNKKKALMDLMRSPEVLRGIMADNPKIRRTTGQAIKEYFLYYADKGLMGGTGAAIKDATVSGVNAAGRAFEAQPVVTQVGPFTGGVENEENPTVTAVDREMMELGIQ